LSASRNDGIPRLPFEAVDPALREALKPTVERLGYFGEFFQVAAHVPGAVPAFMQYTGAVKAPLEDRHNEVLALSVCSMLEADYERIQHERLSRKLGFTLEWIAAAEGRPDSHASALQEDERALQALAQAMVSSHGLRCEAELRAVVSALGPQEAVAALLQVSRFVTIALLCNALALELPVPSVFDGPAVG
jgi:alkylhydroperoxidase family enzyme